MPLLTFPVDVLVEAEIGGSLPPISAAQAPTGYGRFGPFILDSTTRLLMYRGRIGTTPVNYNVLIPCITTDNGQTWNAVGYSTSPHMKPGFTLDYTCSWDGSDTVWIAYSSTNSNGDPEGVFIASYTISTQTFGAGMDMARSNGIEFSSCWRNYDSTFCVISSGTDPLTGNISTWLLRYQPSTNSVLGVDMLNTTGGTINGVTPNRICEGDVSSGLLHITATEFIPALNPNPDITSQITVQSMDSSNTLSGATLIAQADYQSFPAGFGSATNVNIDMCYDPATNKVRIIYSNYTSEYIATGTAPSQLKIRCLIATSAFNLSLSLEGTVSSIGSASHDFIDQQCVCICASGPTIGIFWNLATKNSTYQSLNFAAGVALGGKAGNEFNFTAVALDNAGNYVFGWYQHYYYESILVPPVITSYNYAYLGRGSVGISRTS
jgi:hypothetical protein